MRRQSEDTGPQLADSAAEGRESLSRKELLASKQTTPLFAYGILVAAILAVSSAACVFKLLEESDVQPITLVGWRLQATSVVLLPMFIVQWRASSEAVRQGWWKAWPLMSASGLALAMHFCTWVFGLNRTSLPHALLFVTSTPILIAAGCVILRLPITRGEVASAVVGFLGMVLCELATSSKADASLVGDLFSLMGAISIIGYLHVGRKLREWMPIFLYALPVTAVSAVVSTVAAMLLEGAELAQLGSQGAFGYFDRQHFGWILYLACGPGIIGHTGFNTLLRFFPPLVISMAFPLEPVIGSIMGAAAGVSALPDPLTWIGGGIMVSALVACTWQQGKHDAQEEKRKAVTLATQQALADDALVELSAFSIVEEEDFSIDES